MRYKQWIYQHCSTDMDVHIGDLHPSIVGKQSEFVGLDQDC